MGLQLPKLLISASPDKGTTKCAHKDINMSILHCTVCSSPWSTLWNRISQSDLLILRLSLLAKSFTELWKVPCAEGNTQCPELIAATII